MEHCSYCGRIGCQTEVVSDVFVPWSEVLKVRVPDHRSWRCSTHNEQFTDHEQGIHNQRQMAESLRSIAGLIEPWIKKLEGDIASEA